MSLILDGLLTDKGTESKDSGLLGLYSGLLGGTDDSKTDSDALSNLIALLKLTGKKDKKLSRTELLQQPEQDIGNTPGGLSAPEVRADAAPRNFSGMSDPMPLNPAARPDMRKRLGKYDQDWRVLR